MLAWGNRHLRAIQFLLGHAKLESTVRYGIQVEDALALAEQTEI
ncbi:hypothetical protein [Azospirillum argentinense]|nr:hypothetical protein [Azospirillum argentinense]